MDLGHGDRWRLDTCQACPAQTLPVGEFDVLERPGPASRYDPAAGYRTNQTTGLPECVHPARVQLPACLYASNHEPPPGPAGPRPQAPDDIADLEEWFGATIRAAPEESRAAALGEAELAARRQFPAAEVLAAMRRALSAELVRGRLVRSPSGASPSGALPSGASPSCQPDASVRPGAAPGQAGAQNFRSAAESTGSSHS